MMVKFFHAHSVIVFISDFFGLEKPGADALLYLASKILCKRGYLMAGLSVVDEGI